MAMDSVKPRNWVYVGLGRSSFPPHPQFLFSHFGASPLWHHYFAALDSEHARRQATRQRLTRERALRRAKPVRFK